MEFDVVSFNEVLDETVQQGKFVYAFVLCECEHACSHSLK